MMDLRDLYQEIIIDHNRNPRNHHEISDASCQANGFNPLCGDKLTVYNEDGIEVYKGIILQDRTSHLRQRPMTSIFQPVCRGFWVHWLQSGVDVDLWGEWFFSGRYTGVVTRKG